MQISQELKQQLEAKFGICPNLPQQLAIKENSGLNLWQYLQACEQDLVDLMNGNPPVENDSANIEYSWVLYFMNNDLQSTLNKIGLGSFYTPLMSLLTLAYGPMPPSQITPTDWANYKTVWEAQGVLYGDGSLVSTAYYAVMDDEWPTALVYYYLS